MKPPLLSCFLLWTATLLVDQTPLQAQYTIKHYTTKDGLSQGSVFYFLEDSRGYMWMTSENGLNRLQGSRFRTYAHDDTKPGSIGKGEVRGLVEASNGDIWTGTQVCLSRYVRRTNRFQNYYLIDGGGNRQFSQNRPFFVDDSTVWFLNSKRGVLRFNYQSNRLQTLLSDVPYEFIAITREVIMDAQHGTLWLRLPKGLLRYDLKTRQRRYYLTDRTDDTIGKERIIYALHGAKDGSIWMSTNKGIGKIDDTGFREYDIGINTENDVVYTLTQPHDSLLWIGTSRNGILVMNPKSGRIVNRFQRSPFRSNSLNDNHISELYADSKGWIWVNVDPKGVDLLFPSSLKPTLLEDDLLDSTDFNSHGVRGIAQDKAGYLWAGTVAEGVRQIDLRTSQMRRYAANEGLKNYGVRSLVCSSTGQLFVGTNGGLGIWNPSQQRFNTLKIPNKSDPTKANVIRNIFELAPNLFLLATSAGFYTLNNRQQIRYLYDSTSAYSGTLLHDRENGLLFAGRRDRDLQCFAIQGTSIRHLYNTLAGYGPTSLYKQGEWLWIGTDNGLIKYHIRSRRVAKRFTTQHGLPDNSVFSLLPDADGDLWISTNHGLAIFDRQNQFTVLPETGNVEFMGNAAYQTDTDHLYFGCTTGLYSVRPSHVKIRNTPPVRFVELTINDQPVKNALQTIDETDTLRLAYNQNTLSVQVAALDYLTNTPTRYQYRLFGQHDHWIDNADNPSIRYTNLLPGWYALQVRALTVAGTWTPDYQLSLFVDQPFWTRLWFRLLLVLLISGAIYGSVRQYVKQKQRAQQQLTNQLIAIQESERHRIAQDLHDDVGNTLAAAKGILNRAMNQQDVHHLTQAQGLIEKAGQDLRTISHNLMPVEFETYTLPYVIQQSVEKANQASGVMVEFIHLGQDQQISPERSLVIYRIVNELINNILKHSGAQSATIQLLYQPERLIVTVEDEGHGIQSINNKKKEEGIGLKNIHSRANYLGARLDVSSNQTGTSIILEVPYG